MKLGLWGARMDNSGLGQQTLEFWRAMKPAKTMVVDISVLERFPERIMKQYPERYMTPNKNYYGWITPPNVTILSGIPNEYDIRQFLAGLDVVFICESAYNFNFYRIAREMGVKTAVQYNYEFFDWTDGSLWAANPPDMFVAPSTWHYDDVSQMADKLGAKHIYLHCPVNRSEIRFRRIESATVFVHCAGRPAPHDRNGTFTFCEAIKLAEGDLSGLVYTQDKNLANEIKHKYQNIKVVYNTSDYCDLYKKGSVFVLPRKYGGNCLPMNEALAAGMPVIMSKLSPQTDFLPERWLVNATKEDVEFAPRFPLDVHQVDPVELMMRMRWFKSLPPDDMREWNNHADALADLISWENMRPKYEEVFEALCKL